MEQIKDIVVEVLSQIVAEKRHAYQNAIHSSEFNTLAENQDKELAKHKHLAIYFEELFWNAQEVIVGIKEIVLNKPELNFEQKISSITPLLINYR